MSTEALAALAAAAGGFEAAQVGLQIAQEWEELAREAFLAADEGNEASCVEELEDARRKVANAHLLVEKRQGALTWARIKADESDAAQRAARIAELRGARTRFLGELREAFPRVLASRRAFAATVDEVLQIMEREAQRAQELRGLGEVEHPTPLDVVRLAIGQTIDREAPAESAELEHLPATVVSLADGILNTENFEEALRRLRNEFVATAGPTLADFCAPQPFVRSGAATLKTELNARDAVSLLREIEELQS